MSADQLKFSLKAFVSVLGVAQKGGSIGTEKADALKLKALDLMEKTEDVEAAADAFNTLIGQFNQFVHQGAPFPPFAGDEQIQGKYDVIAFQVFLNHELVGHHFSSQDQNPLFDSSSHLWRAMGTELTYEEGLEELGDLIAEANSHLPEDHHYPKP